MKISVLSLIAMLLISNTIVFFITSVIADENQPQLPPGLEQADLSIFKSTNVEIAFPGQSLIYTLNITNNGPHTASNIIVYDTLSDKHTFDNANPTQNGLNGSTYWWDIGSLNVNQSKQITIYVKINDNATGTIINNANVTSDTYDPSNKYNNDSVQVSIVSVADLSITKTANTNFVYVGDYIIYTINVTNNGPDDAVNVIIYDTLPNEVTFNFADPAPNGNIGSVYWWYYSFLYVGESIIITINVTVNKNASGKITNTANVTSDTYDPNPGEDSNEDDWQTDISQPSSGGGGGVGGGTANLHPTADPNGPYFGFKGEEIEFDGTGSFDKDEGGLSIVQYDWKFFDEDDWLLNIGATPKYIYYEVGIYNVTLRVIDDEGSSSISKTTATISQANLPPTNIVITGADKGHQNISYNYSMYASDPDGDNISYNVDWDDGDSDISNPITNEMTYTVDHMWTVPGHYVITVYATDEQNAQSEKAYFSVLIDILYVKDIGYLIDYNSDGTYENFFSNKTRKETDTEKLDDGRYLINDDDDDKWEWIYNPDTETLEVYYHGDEIDLTLWYLLLIILLLTLITILFLLYKKKKKKETPMETSTQTHQP